MEEHTPPQQPATGTEQEIESLCERFRSAWKTGQAPRISEFLQEVNDPEYGFCLERLLELDLEYRQRFDSLESVEDYYAQFPDYKSIVDTALKRHLSTLATPATDTVDWVRDSRVPASSQTTQPAPVRSIGRFQIIRLLGQGAFGAVYQAHDPQLDRNVALKIPRAGTLVSEEDVRRFMREARAAAQLRHPNLVTVYEAGEFEGTVYIAADLIRGRSLRARLSAVEEPLSTRQAVEWLALIAEALHYAHNKGIVHRDVKPENIMLDDHQQPQVMDFGLARRDEGDNLRTQAGVTMGTPAYMSPEQAKGESHLADARSDLWSLGVVLYEMLTGRRPFEGRGKYVLLEILEFDPPAPSQIRPTIPRDLENICLKCLHKNPADRYPSCQHLADDLGRFLRSEPVAARPIGWLERTARSCRRNPLVASLVAVAMVSVLLSFAALAVGYIRTTLALESESAAVREKEGALERLKLEQEAVLRAKKESDALRVEAEQQAKHLLSRRLAEQARAMLASQPDRALLLAAEAVDLFVKAEQPPELLARNALVETIVESSTRALMPHHHSVETAIFASSGAWLTTIDDRRLARTWPIQEPVEPAPLLDGSHGGLRAFVLSRSGRWLAVVSSSGQLRLHDFHSDTTYDLYQTSDRQAEFHSLSPANVAFTHDEARLVFCGTDPVVRIWNLNELDSTTGPAVALKRDRSVISKIALSPVSGLMATANVSREVVLWDLEQTNFKTPLATYPEHAERIVSMTFGPAGHWLVIGSDDNSLRLVDLQKPREPPTQAVLSDAPQIIEFGGNGRWLLTVAGRYRERNLQLWDLSQPFPFSRPTLAEEIARPESFCLAQTGNRLAVSLPDKAGVRVWDLSPDLSEPSAFDLPINDQEVNAMGFDATGTRLGMILDVYGPADDTLEVWEITQGKSLRRLHKFSVPVKIAKNVAFSPSGRFLAAGGGGVLNGEEGVWDLDAENPAGSGWLLPRHDENLTSVQFSTDGKWLLAGSPGRLDVLKTDAGLPMDPYLQFHADWILDAAYSPDGRWPALARQDGRIVVRDLTRIPQEQKVLSGHEQATRKLEFTPDGRWLISSGSDETVRLWNFATSLPNLETAVLRGRSSHYIKTNVSPNGRWLLTSGETLGLCDLHTDDPAAAFAELGTFGRSRFSPDSRWLVVATETGVVLFSLKSQTANDPIPPSHVPPAIRRAAEQLEIEVSLGMIGGYSSLTEFAFNAASTRLVMGGSGGQIEMFELHSGGMARRNAKFPKIDGRVDYLSFIDGDARIATRAVQAEYLGLFDSQNPSHPPREYPLPDRYSSDRDIVVSSDGRWMALPVDGKLSSGTSHTWLVHDLSNGNSLKLSSERPVVTIAFSPDSKWLATLRSDLKVRLHELDAARSQSRKFEFLAHHDPPGGYFPGSLTVKPLVTFSPDSRWLITADGRGVPVIRRIPAADEHSTDLIDYARQTAGRILTAEERANYLLETSNSGSSVP